MTMICTELLTIRDREYIHTWSDAGMMIERDGARYEDAIDPAGFGRVYAETDEPIKEPDLQPGAEPEEAYRKEGTNNG